MLQKILASKQAEIAYQKNKVPLSYLKDACQAQNSRRSFINSLQNGNELAIIAEVKQRSPSKGVLCPNFDPVAIACAYAAAGAAAISVLTDQPFFGGSLQHLNSVRQRVALPLLRKDFIIDTYQLYEARAAGADAVLLIVAALEPRQLQELFLQAHELRLDVLVEVHTEKEIDIAAGLPARLIGINNRNLTTFHTNLAVTKRLAPLAPANCTLVSESGIRSPADVMDLSTYGVDAVLVGEQLLRQADHAAALKSLL